jgi:DNA repair protein SbcC/Rad50
LPGAESLGAFLISSDDLAALGTTDAHISTQLRTLLAGGYDLDARLAASATTGSTAKTAETGQGT